ncbi:MAG: hypothetical protein A2620_04525 [Acidobacteria bacterium RIFCSPHIGHO2_01_FULL_67_28]|nr:MAG: hypothetical protein A2620_04525 [Acidobacteria bacterium RIFCSPHIGHO2_01_FULL_67_28]
MIALGFTPGKITAAPGSDAYIYRTARVHLAVPQTALARALEPPQDVEPGAPWAVELKLEARWLHAADIFRKNGLPAHRLAFEQYLTCLAKTGLFPSRVDGFYEFEAPEFLDLAVSLNTKAEADDLTPEILRQVVPPVVDALVRAELYLVFAATLDVLRYELRQKEEAARIHLPGRG